MAEELKDVEWRRGSESYAASKSMTVAWITREFLERQRCCRRRLALPRTVILTLWTSRTINLLRFVVAIEAHITHEEKYTLPGQHAMLFRDILREIQAVSRADFAGVGMA